MNNMRSTLLEFDPQLNKLGKRKELRCGLSAVVQVGNTLWVANDETINLERLSRQEGNTDSDQWYGKHKQFVLSDYLSLPVPPDHEGKKKIEEADIEGLDYQDGYLWLVGSHSLKRSEPEPDENTVEENFKCLANVSVDGNRYLLARIPLVEKDGTYTLEKKADHNGKQRTAAKLPGSATGNRLTEALANDEHLKQFKKIPGKDNGFDIEGLAVAGNRVFVGLRGPVLRGWAVILELHVDDDGENRSKLKLRNITTNHWPNAPYRKHFLDMDGFGVRDLCVYGSDLLILAGPTMDLDGPVTIFRWEGGAQPSGESLVSRDQLQTVVDVPYGQGEDKGRNHAEGMTLFSADDSEARNILVVYDSASDSRQVEQSAVKVDVLALLV